MPVRLHAPKPTTATSRVVRPRPSPALRLARRPGACACGGGCPRCAGRSATLDGLRLTEPDDAQEREADAMARRALGPGPGRLPAGSATPAPTPRTPSAAAPLDAAMRGFMESRLGASFGDVRLHDDLSAATAAAALEARAYTVGNSIVFGAGQYAPNTQPGRMLLAHELAHVVQQRRSGARVQRAPAFGSMYRGADSEVRSHLQLPYDDYKAGLAPTQASSETPGARHPLDPKEPLTTDELLEIFTGVAADIEAGKVSRELIDSYVARLNSAFVTFALDTVEAQASFLANAYRESDQFRFLTETEKAVKSNPPYQADPRNARLFEGYLQCAAKRSDEVKRGLKPTDDAQCPNVIDYELGGSINATGQWGESFIGRGAIQVTHRHAYVQVLAVMEHRADELESADRDSSEAKALRSAIEAIAADPRQAANPAYSFLFSVAFMKVPDDSEGHETGDAKASRGQVTSWMGQQPADAKAAKDAAYHKAHRVLMGKWQQQLARYGYGVADDPISGPGFGASDAPVRPGPVRSTMIRTR